MLLAINSHALDLDLSSHLLLVLMCSNTVEPLTAVFQMFLLIWETKFCFTLFRVLIWLSVKVRNVWTKWENGVRLIMQQVVGSFPNVWALGVIVVTLMTHLSSPFSAFCLRSVPCNTSSLFIFFSCKACMGFEHFQFNLGLTKKVLRSTISEKEAEKQVKFSFS